MDQLYPSMLEKLTAASEKIQDHLVKSFHGTPSPLTEEQKDEYVDALYHLRNRLIQLNSSVNIEYEFDQGLTGDIEDYTKLLNQYRPQLEELVGFLLDSPNAFPDDLFAKHRSLFLNEVLEDIIHHSNTLNNLLT